MHEDLSIDQYKHDKAKSELCRSMIQTQIRHNLPVDNHLVERINNDIEETVKLYPNETPQEMEEKLKTNKDVIDEIVSELEEELVEKSVRGDNMINQLKSLLNNYDETYDDSDDEDEEKRWRIRRNFQY